MTRGSTPTFVFTLPSDTSVYSDIDIYFSQNGSVILDVTQAALTLSGNEVSFTMTEEESLKFTASVPAEIQIRLVTGTEEYLSRKSGGSPCLKGIRFNEKSTADLARL